MIRFECDYAEGACPEIIKKLQETNMEQTPGYGEDIYCNSAREKESRTASITSAEETIFPFLRCQKASFEK